MRVDKSWQQRPKLGVWLSLSIVVGSLALLGAGPGGLGESSSSHESAGTTWTPFAFFNEKASFGTPETIALLFSLTISLLALVYAFVLGKTVFAADQGTRRMQEIAQAVRDGSNAYLKRQFTTVGILLIFLTAMLVMSKWPWDAPKEGTVEDMKVVAISRGAAFLFGALFSASVGFFGMRLATTGNLRVAAAARVSFSKAMRLGYQTGTVTGMLTAGLGLLGGVLIVMMMGERAYQTLLGFAFGGSLLALFMRVGGGIYTKAADVGADLVGKIEADVPEDDPRNAATIADNVGDNVGDCAGMAADVFESYTVTMVAAMILGYAAFGPKALLLPLLIQAVGILSSLISTSLVGRGTSKGGASGAMKAINWSFRTGALLSVIGIFAVSALFLRFDRVYIVSQGVERGLYKYAEFEKELGFHDGSKGLDSMASYTVLEQAIKGKTPLSIERRVQIQKWIDHRPAQALKIWRTLSPEKQSELTNLQLQITVDGYPQDSTVFKEADKLVPVGEGYDIRPALACLIGVILTLALMFCTEYWTSTEYGPVQSITKNSRTGHATNIIQGIAVGYESTVWSVLLVAAAVFAGVFVYQDSNNPIFVAFGVSMCGIGMLALTGDTLSMDVFGPVADNANGIGEMGYNRDDMNQKLKPGQPDYFPENEEQEARQILSDLDATGNTTKAITKGIAIGSAVIAAVSLFASFIAVLVKQSEEKINELTAIDFETKAGFLSVAKPDVFIGMLIGGAVPFLFSSMTIRAVGRAAFLIVNECRKQFADKEIWAGTKKPDYGRVVAICTSTAQKELVGPGLLAIFTPILVGFLLGPYALGGFLAGMIVVGQLLAVFMATSGGAWDNAKKMIEDQPKSRLSGKGSDQHKASVTGDTVGDPLKDTAGPAINPLIKVMNMVSLLVLPLVISFNIKSGEVTGSKVGYFVLAVCFLAVGWAWWQSKRDTQEMRNLDAQYQVDLEAALLEAKKKHEGEMAN